MSMIREVGTLTAQFQTQLSFVRDSASEVFDSDLAGKRWNFGGSLDRVNVLPRIAGESPTP